MEIAILGYRREMRDEVERHIRGCLGENSPFILRQYGMDEPKYNPVPPDTAAAFVIVDDARALESLRKAADWGERLPLVIVSNHPQYALEGIRLQVKHYLLFPLVEEDMREALRRVEKEVAPGGSDTGF